MKLANKVLAAALLAMVCTTAWFWGSQGHRMVAYVADSELNAKARIAVRKIIGDDLLASVAYWMNEVRSSPEGRAMKTWHYVDTRVCGSGQPWCPNEGCAITKIEWARDQLKTAKGDDALLACGC
jgi:hypothetical protein